MADPIRFKKRSKDHHSTTDVKKFIRGPVRLGELLKKSNEKENTVIYIHVPFCTKICSFCNMRRSLSKAYEDYDKLLIKHIEAMALSKYGKSSKIGSVYFGGGTPTTMNEKQLTGVLDAIFRNFKVKKDAEISMETTLTEMPVEKLKTLTKYGLNRISVGVQTFDDKGRKLLNRNGDGNFARKKLTEYLDTGFRNVNIDLIYNYPYQTEEELRRDMEVIGSLDLAGFSMYSLILMNDSQLAKKIEKSALELKNDIKHDRFYHNIVVEEGEKYAYEFFEFTKMVRPDRDQYKYIQYRNAGEDTIPIGAGAGGNILGAAGMNPISVKDYIESLNNIEDRTFMQFDPAYEAISKASKAVQFGKIDLKLLPTHLLEVAKSYAEGLVEEGFLSGNGPIYHLTDEGRYWGNNINKEYMDLLVTHDRNFAG